LTVMPLWPQSAAKLRMKPSTAALEGVVRDTGHGGRDRGHEYDAAAVCHVPVGVLGDEELRPRVEPEDAVVVFFRDVFFRAEDFRPGVGDDDVEAAEVGQRLREEV